MSLFVHKAGMKGSKRAIQIVDCGDVLLITGSNGVMIIVMVLVIE